MDAAFLPNNEGGRANFLQFLMQSFGCSYICLWSYLPLPSNFLFFLDGLYQIEDQQSQLLPSSSTGTSLARRLFEEYTNSVFIVFQNEKVPGYAFKNNIPFIQLQDLELFRLASNQIQAQFYQEARIKTAVFMGCKSGEIEIGWSNVSQINTKTEMIRSWFAEGSATQLFQVAVTTTAAAENIPMLNIDDHQNPITSTSSSSLRSLSNMDSPHEHSSLLFNFNPISTTTTTSCQIPELNPNLDLLNIIPPHQKAIQAFSQIRSTQFPITPETEDAAMTRAILAVLNSSSSSSSFSSSYCSHHQPQHSCINTQLMNPISSAFKNYKYSSALAPSRTQISAQLSKQSLIKRSISFFRSLYFMRIHQSLQATRPTTTQLHHMIQERKRRKKLNERFQAMRALLPPGTKKDKASLLRTTREHLTSLKAQVSALSQRNKELVAQAPPTNNLKEEVLAYQGRTSERVVVRLQRVSHDQYSTSEESELIYIDLQVILTRDRPVEDVVIRILDFLKQVNNVSFMSMKANTTQHLTQTIPINHVNLRIRVEGISEFDEAVFQEAVRRAVADLAQ